MILLPQVRVDLGVISIKEYSTLLTSPELEPQHRIKLRVIPRTLLFLGGWVGS